MVHLGEQDQLCPPEAQAVVKGHLASSVNSVVYTYANVGHAFARLGRSGIAAEAGDLADQRTIEFLRLRLS